MKTMYTNWWEIMRQGETEHALTLMRENFAQESGTSEAMELGVGYLWLKDYEAAWEHFNMFNQRYPRHADCTYAMAGAAKWCLNKTKEALKEWEIGDTCDYADAGQFEIPMLLLFASVVQPSVFDKSKAEELLIERTEQAGFTDWPVPIAEFIVGAIDELELRGRCFDERFQDETAFHHWQADFYLGVQKLNQDDESGFRELMRKVGNVTWEDFDQDQDLFLSKMWSPEFFLARHEGFGR
jgi:lipoprotein NlpI